MERAWWIMLRSSLFFIPSRSGGGITIINVIDSACARGRIFSYCTSIGTTYISVLIIPRAAVYDMLRTDIRFTLRFSSGTARVLLV